MNKTQVIALEELQTITVNVTEPILDELFLEFVYTSFEQNSMVLNHKHKIFSFYHASTQQYFLCAFESSYSHDVITPLMLSAYYSNQTDINSTDLFILDDFFALFIHGKLSYFKVLKEFVLKHEIKNFVEKSFNVQLDNLYEVSKKEFEAFQKQFLKHYDTQHAQSYISNPKRKQLKRFIFYNATLIVVLAFYFLYEGGFKDETFQPSQTSTTIKQKELYSLKIVKLFENIASSNLKLETFEFNQNKVSLKLSHQHKMTLIDFLTLYHAKIEQIHYNMEENIYELTATFELN